MTDPEEMAGAVEGSLVTILRDGMDHAIRRYETENILALPETFRDKLTAELSQAWLYATEKAGAAMVEEFRSYGFEHLETKADEQDLFERIRDMFIERYGASRVTQIFQTTRDQLLRLIQEGQREGLAVDAIASRIRSAIPEMARLRAHVIARTETHSANRFAQQQTARESRRALNKTWVSVADPRTRDFGEGDSVIDDYSHRAMNGVTVPLDQPYYVPTKYGTKEPLMFPGDPNGSAGNLINCFVEGTTVLGRFEAAARALYRGDVIEIKTAGGREVTITPNHPVVANGRFVPAHEVRKGDDLVAYSGEIKSAGGVGNKDIDLRPSPAEDIFAAFAKACEPLSARVGGIDFHGDGQFIESNVEIVAPKRQLPGACDAALGKFLDDVGFIYAGPPTDHLSSPLANAFLAVRHATDGIMSGLGEALSFFGAGLGHAGVHGLAAGSWRAARTDNSTANGAAFNADILGNAFDAFARLVPFANGVVRDARQSAASGRSGVAEHLINARSADAERLGNILELHSGVVEPDHVISVIRKFYSGHVYDFQEVSGLMIAGGLLMSNCRCAETYRRADRDT